MAELPRRFNDVVCGLLLDSGRVLLVHRNASRLWDPNCWDAPGGHIEMGESDFDALKRELREELGIQVTPDKARVVGRLVGDDYDARVFLIDAWRGVPRTAHHTSTMISPGSRNPTSKASFLPTRRSWGSPSECCTSFLEPASVSRAQPFTPLKRLLRALYVDGHEHAVGIGAV